MDDVDKIIAQWRRERPDLDVEPMALIGRLNRLSRHINTAMERTFSAYGLNAPSFDVLATLRRSGKPFELSPGDLMSTMMITSGTMTNRIDQLVKRNLVERVNNKDDGRSFLIRLSPEGLALVEKAVTTHVETQKRLVDALPQDQRQILNTYLKQFLTGFEQTSRTND